MRYILLLLLLTSTASAGEPWQGKIGDHPDWREGCGFDTSDVPCDADRWTENNWSDWLAKKLNLPLTNDVREYTVDTGHRVDIKSHSEAIEVEWDRKFHASVGQALHYSNRTGLPPAVILLVRDPEGPYADYCRKICEQSGVILYIQVVPERPKAIQPVPDTIGGKTSSRRQFMPLPIYGAALMLAAAVSAFPR
ncbi:hypothetical protein [Rubinisphaera brasiliensis]|uniref:Uncharacterized protein n=1 Tax=Rubinisphaera brasiliensis (strain ATCC 49424 / DSM 5305 / JCM 21570 / IAM 15109 / NBRC 103401 / IFAM 1448) TaxID=756272 RepID=F0SNK5_RUBBR|nr:hypothetical protein [Rubinisphaera brasiliensis]ADY57839.1 hypothetical protein Plabr_0210 [Rubinisphaera brasiliensis DSM 5305]